MYIDLEILNRGLFIAIFTVAMLLVMKTLVGVRFPWETCQCCKKKIRDHK